MVWFALRKDMMLSAVIDSRYTGHDAGEVLDGKKNGIPIFASVEAAFDNAAKGVLNQLYFVIGLAPDGGRLDVGRQEGYHQSH